MARHGTELFDALVTDASVRAAVDTLLEHKRRAGEAREGAPVAVIDDWIQAQLHRLSACHIASAAPDFGVLDRLLFGVVTEAGSSIRKVPSPR